MELIKMIKLPTNKASIVGSIEVKVGDRVKKDDTLLTVESAKGLRPIKSPGDGKINKLFIEIGDQVVAGDDLVGIELLDGPINEEKNLVGESAKAPVENKEADLVIIGGGPGGYVAAIYAALNGRKVTLIEKDKLGGTCLNEGCIPTKAFIESSSLYEKMSKLEEFAIKADNISYDFSKLQARKNKIVTNLGEGIDFLMKKNGIEVIKASASFESDKKIICKGDKTYSISFKDAIVASGSKQAMLDIEGIDSRKVITSREALKLDKLPKSISIIGGGVIGMEFAFIFANLGIEVNLIEFLPTILANIDEEASRLLADIARDKGIRISDSSRVTSIKETENDLAIVNYEKDGEKHCLASEMVLLAVGRVPNIEGLGLEKAGIAVNKNAILVDQYMASNKEHIYAIGDVTNIMQLAHVASYQGILAVDNMNGKKRKANYRAIPSVIFTDPEIAIVGVEKADQTRHMVSRFDFNGNGKAQIMAKNKGFVKLIKDRESGYIVGATIIGPDASTIVNTASLAISEKMTEKELAGMIFPHPTTGEALHEAAMGLGLGMIHQ